MIINQIKFKFLFYSSHISYIIYLIERMINIYIYMCVYIYIKLTCKKLNK